MSTTSSRNEKLAESAGPSCYSAQDIQDPHTRTFRRSAERHVRGLCIDGREWHPDQLGARA